VIRSELSKKTSDRNVVGALAGSVPAIVFAAANFVLFYCSPWAREHPGIACLLFAPAYGLMCSKQIVCNFTHMPAQVFPKSFLWFGLFPLNRLLSLLAQRGYLMEHGYSTHITGDVTLEMAWTLPQESLILPESTVAMVVFAINLFWYLTFVTCTIH
jgi:hypothetical protein